MGHDLLACPQRLRPVVPESSTPEQQPRAEEEQHLATDARTIMPAQAPIITPTDYGPWVQVQRRSCLTAQRLPPQQQHFQQKIVPSSCKSTSSHLAGSRFLVLEGSSVMETGPAPTGVCLQQFARMGQGHTLQLDQVLGPTQIHSTGLLFKAQGPSHNTKKGPRSSNASPIPYTRGESSRASPQQGQILAPCPQIQFQPIQAKKHVAIEIPTHMEMVCERPIMVAH
ncbi:hypothetical protein K2173_028318 [Erythroxylum novogranatense]|uniref:Uncharacterized protein n=1 Tax=Erythroxylum novogranatense TaxID=1862640 RepID=A0AAV8U1I5_9ROSI|nr:hypothetical protein K2173_028318 [Erythroxylum novogranatense]